MQGELTLTPALEHLARAREAHVVASEKLDEATRHNTALLVRQSEAQARSAEALRLARDGDADGKLAMQMKLADEDVCDLQALIEQSQPVIASLTEAVKHASAMLQKAQENATREEAEIQGRELDAVIRELDAKLCEAVTRRLACHNMLNPKALSRMSCFTIYQASPLLKNIVSKGVVDSRGGL